MEFVNLLRKEYHARSHQNSSYSVRAFARDLGVDQSVISRVMVGKRKPSVKLIEHIAVRLGFAPQDILKATQTARRHKNDSHQYKDLSIEAFVVASDSYHDAILELIDTHDFEPSADWVAKRLRLPIKDVKAAIDRLTKLEMLEIKSSGRWVDVSKHTQLHPTNNDCVELRKYQQQVLDSSSKALASLPISERSHNSITFSASKEKLPELKKLISRFRKEAFALMDSSDELKTDVFQLHVGFFPLTENKNQGDES